jgi:hypothetical protein
LHDIYTVLHLLAHWEVLQASTRNYVVHRLRLLYIAVTKGWPAAVLRSEGFDEFQHLASIILGRLPAACWSQGDSAEEYRGSRQVLHKPRTREEMSHEETNLLPTRPLSPSTEAVLEQQRTAMNLFIQYLLHPQGYNSKICNLNIKFNVLFLNVNNKVLRLWSGWPRPSACIPSFLNNAPPHAPRMGFEPTNPAFWQKKPFHAMYHSLFREAGSCSAGTFL